MSRKQSEQEALAQLQRVKSAYQSFIKINYEHAAENCRTCPTRGLCCTDTHFVNVHITRLEAVAIRETLRRTPRLTDEARRAVYERARLAIERYQLRASGDTFSQTYSCPLYDPTAGCLVHARAKPAPCVQHACYENWEDLPPASLQTRTERWRSAASSIGRIGRRRRRNSGARSRSTPSWRLSARSFRSFWPRLAATRNRSAKRASAEISIRSRRS